MHVPLGVLVVSILAMLGLACGWAYTLYRWYGLLWVCAEQAAPQRPAMSAGEMD